MGALRSAGGYRGGKITRPLVPHVVDVSLVREVGAPLTVDPSLSIERRAQGPLVCTMSAPHRSVSTEGDGMNPYTKTLESR
jgi:hypothetical protein